MATRKRSSFRRRGDIARTFNMCRCQACCSRFGLRILG